MNDRLQVERQRAAAKGEEYADPIDCPVQWSVGAPLPLLLVNELRALLAFRTSEGDNSEDGNDLEPLALVDFESCYAAKLGGPNDEVLNGHALYGKGLAPYSAQRVVNSRWLAELEEINRVHRQYRASMWRDCKHFIFWFHDSVFECIAESFTVEVYRMPIRELLHKMAERLIS